MYRMGWSGSRNPHTFHKQPEHLHQCASSDMVRPQGGKGAPRLIQSGFLQRGRVGWCGCDDVFAFVSSTMVQGARRNFVEKEEKRLPFGKRAIQLDQNRILRECIPI